MCIYYLYIYFKETVIYILKKYIIKYQFLVYIFILYIRVLKGIIKEYVNNNFLFEFLI